MLAALIRPIFNAENARAGTRARSATALERLEQAAAEDRRAARRGRGRPARLLRLPGRPLAQAALDQPLERVNREIGRRTDVVGIFPNDRSLIRLAASVVIEQNDEWLVGHRYLSQHSLDAILTDYEEDNNRKETPELAAA